MVEYSQAYLFSSDPKNGAIPLGTDGSSFSVQFNGLGIAVPDDARACTVEVQQCSIWNTAFNISSEIGNNRLSYQIGGVLQPDIEIPDGQYGVSDLASLVSRELIGAGQEEDAIQIVGDDSTQKIILVLNAGFQVDFTTASGSGISEMLGFTERVVPSVPSGVDGTYEYADRVAQFARVSSFLLTGTLVSDGLPVNDGNAGILASVPILVKSGSLSIYEPAQPLRIDAKELIGRPKQQLTFRLLDQLKRSVNTNSETYSFTIVLRYTVA